MADTPTTPAAGTPPPPAPGTPAHDAAMAARADAIMAQSGAPAAAATEAPKRPDHVPEKFWDAEKGVVRTDDLVKSYRELETKLGQPKPAVTPAKAGEALAVPDGAAAQVAKAGLDMDALNAEFADKGELSAETLKKLEDGGIPKPMVDSYIAGQKALATEYTGKAHEVAGGADKFQAMQTWAASNMTPAEAKVYNEAVTSGDVAKMQFAVTALKSRYTAAEGDKPALVTGGNANGEVGYASRADMTADMRKPEYKKDPAFRATVERKVAATTAF